MMKIQLATVLALFFLLLSQVSQAQQVITFWNFNDANDPGVPDETIRI